MKSEVGIYVIPCNNCNKNYIGKTSDLSTNEFMNTYEISNLAMIGMH